MFSGFVSKGFIRDLCFNLLHNPLNASSVPHTFIIIIIIIIKPELCITVWLHVSCLSHVLTVVVATASWFMTDFS
jgi:hypothetical protein